MGYFYEWTGKEGLGIGREAVENRRLLNGGVPWLTLC